MNQLSTYFSLEEMTHSDTAKRLGMDNTPSEKQIESLKVLCNRVLDPLREYMGRPLHINSGYRCPALNKAVGGSPSSQHMQGQAADVQCRNLKEGRKMLEFIAAECHFDQCFVETNGQDYWLHVSFVTPIDKNRCTVKLLQRKQ